MKRFWNKLKAVVLGCAELIGLVWKLDGEVSMVSIMIVDTETAASIQDALNTLEFTPHD